MLGIMLIRYRKDSFPPLKLVGSGAIAFQIAVTKAPVDSSSFEVGIQSLRVAFPVQDLVAIADVACWDQATTVSSKVAAFTCFSWAHLGSYPSRSQQQTKRMGPRHYHWVQMPSLNSEGSAGTAIVAEEVAVAVVGRPDWTRN